MSAAGDVERSMLDAWRPQYRRASRQHERRSLWRLDACEEAALKAGNELGRAVGRNALARVRGLIPDDEGAAESRRLWDEIECAAAAQKLAREQKAERLKRRRRSK